MLNATPATTTTDTTLLFSARFDGESLFSGDYNAKLIKERMMARADALQSRTAVHFNEAERANLARNGAIPNVDASHQVKTGNELRRMALRA